MSPQEHEQCRERVKVSHVIVECRVINHRPFYSSCFLNYKYKVNCIQKINTLS